MIRGRRRVRSILAVAACLGLATGPASNARGAPPDGPPPEARVREGGRDGAAGFAASLYREVASGASNVVLSPLSASAALRVARAGAGGETAGEFDRALRGEADAAFAAHLRRWRGDAPAPGAEGQARFRLADAVWVDSGYPVAASFRSTLVERFGAEVRPAPFRTEPARAVD